MDDQVLKKVKEYEEYEEYEQIEIIGAGWMLIHPSKNDSKEYKDFKRMFSDVLNRDVLVAKESKKGKKVCLYV